jgi:hypothetical protein
MRDLVHRFRALAARAWAAHREAWEQVPFRLDSWS